MGAGYKLCRINKVFISANKIPVAVTHDGRTIRYPDPDVRVNDTVKFDIASGKIVDFAKFDVGNKAMITRGANSGRVGVISTIERHPGGFDIVHLQDAKGQAFATRLNNVFVLGEGTNSWITIPRGRGIRKSIFE